MGWEMNMETSNLLSVVSSPVQRTEASTKVASARVERQREENSAERVQGGRRGGKLLEAFSETLSQLGFTAPAGKGAPPATASEANDAESAAANTGQNAEKAMQNFAYTLFQALGPGAGNNNAQSQRRSPPEEGAENESSRASAIEDRGRKAYGNIENRLQNLAQSLSTPSSSGSETGSAASGTSALETAFQNLSKTLQADTGTGSSKMPDLQSFLQTLKQNLQNAGGRLDSAGNIVNTIA